MRRRLALLLASCVALVACGGSDDAGDVDAFCDAVLALNDPADDDDLDDSDGGADLEVGGFQRLATTAPAPIDDDAARMVEILRQLAVLADDPDPSTEIALPLLAEFEEAGGRVAQFAQDNCPDLPPEIFSS